MKLENKVAIITGASRGIGAQIAKALAKEGAMVVINYAKNKTAADQVVSEIQGAGDKAIAIKADVSKADEVKALFDSSIAHFGKVDILVNNAGIAVFKRLQDTSEDEFDRSFDINVKGVFLTLREAAVRLESGGRIINLSWSLEFQVDLAVQRAIWSSWLKNAKKLLT